MGMALDALEHRIPVIVILLWRGDEAVELRGTIRLGRRWRCLGHVVIGSSDEMRRWSDKGVKSVVAAGERRRRIAAVVGGKVLEGGGSGGDGGRSRGVTTRLLVLVVLDGGEKRRLLPQKRIVQGIIRP